MTRHGLWLLTLPALFACGAGSDGTTPDIQGDTVSLEIGVEGATLVSVDGQATLTVPANALPARTKISIRPVTTALGPSYRFEPDGLVFQVRPTLSLPVPEALRGQDVAITKIFDDGFLRFHETRLSADGAKASAEIPGFSVYGMATPTIETPNLSADLVATTVALEFTWPGAPGGYVRVERAKTIGAPLETDFELVAPEWTVNEPFREGFVELGSGLTYHYRVYGVSPTAQGPVSNVVSVADPYAGPPGAPTGFMAQQRSSTEIELSWNRDATATSYELERSPDGTTFSAVGTYAAAITQHLDSGLTADTDYTYRLRVLRSGAPGPWAMATGSTRVGWRSLGGSMNHDPNRRASRPSLGTSPTGEVYAAWTERGASSGGVYAAHWDGSVWSPMGAGLEITPNTTNAPRAALAVDSGGQVMVAWIEDGGAYLKFWDGSTWSALGGNILLGTPGSDEVLELDLAFMPDGTPMVALAQSNSSGQQQIHLRRFNGAGWDTVGTTSAPIAGATSPDLVISGAGAPIIAWQRRDLGASEIVVQRWNGATFDALGDPASDPARGAATFPSIALDGAGEIVVAFTQATTRTEVVTRRLTGTTWTDLPSAHLTTDKSGYTPQLATGPDGALHITFAEDGAAAPSTTIHVRRFDGSDWISVGQPVAEAAAYLRAPTIVLPAANKLVVGWEAGSLDGSTAVAHTSAFGL